MKSPSVGPLAKGWIEWRDGLVAHGRNETDCEIARLMFYAGAKVAVVAAGRHPMAILTMMQEMQEFERERKRADA